MRITCQSCRSDFVLPLEIADPRGARSTCPFCNAEYELKPADADGRQKIVFSGDVRKTRICINCGKEYETDVVEGIPVCPECQGAQKESARVQPREAWKVSQQGKVVELDSEGSVRDWIRQGYIFPGDRIVSPEGRSIPAKNFPQFQEAFRLQAERRHFQAKSPSFNRQARRFLRPGLVIQIFLVILGSSLLGWFSYRLATLPPLGSTTDPRLDRVVAELRTKVSSPSRPADALLEQAKRLLTLDLPESDETARKLLEQALTIHPTDSNVVGRLAETYAIAAQYGDRPQLRLTAVDLADAAVRMAPIQVDGYVAKARAALAGDDFQTAQESSRRAMELDPVDARALLTRARVLLAGGQSDNTWNEAIGIASSAIQRDPLRLEGYDLVGYAHILRAEPKLARQAFEKRLQQQPEDARALYRLGALEDRAMRPDRAKEFYERALRGSPGTVPARLALAFVHSRILGDEKLAERHLRDIQTRYVRFARPEELFEAQQELIRILLKTGRKGEGHEIALKFPVLAHGAERIAIARASLMEADGHPKEAISTLEEALRSNPTNFELAFAYARMLDRRGTSDQAIRAYRTLIELKPEKLLPYLYLINVFAQVKREEEAVDVANAAVTRAGLEDPSNHWIPPQDQFEEVSWEPLTRRFETLNQRRSTAVTNALLGLTWTQRWLDYRGAAHLQKAIPYLQRAVDLDSKSEYAPLYLGRAYFHAGNLGSAAATFRSALKINSSSAPAHYWLGATLQRKGQLKQAETELTNALADKEWEYRALNLMGDLAKSRGALNEAEDLWRDSLRKSPLYVPPWKSLLDSAG